MADAEEQQAALFEKVSMPVESIHAAVSQLFREHNRMLVR